MKKQLISALIPAYNEEECLYELYKRVSSVLSKLEKYDYEILIINDGSKDKTLEILHDLNAKDKVRDTFYSEVLDLISSYEGGFSEILKNEYLKKGARLEYYEVDKLFDAFSEQKLYEPLKNKARNKMASRDLAFRDALHLRLTEYISPLDKTEFERFLGLKSQELLERMKESEEVFKRLKERE